MNTNTLRKGSLFFLLHPGDPQFAGYGLTLEPGQISPLVGLLIVDRPQPASAGWLAQVAQQFGDYALVPMNRQGERGIFCRMWIAAESLPQVQPLAGAFTQTLQTALFPLLSDLPAPQFDVRWDANLGLWQSQFRTVDGPHDGRAGRMRERVPLFALGQVVATPGALAALEESGQTAQEFLHRHVCGDWGTLPPEDSQANELALQHGARLLSSYVTRKGTKIWVITEHDRSVTTLLTPSEY